MGWIHINLDQDLDMNSNSRFRLVGSEFSMGLLRARGASTNLNFEGSTNTNWSQTGFFMLLKMLGRHIRIQNPAQLVLNKCLLLLHS